MFDLRLPHPVAGTDLLPRDPIIPEGGYYQLTPILLHSPLSHCQSILPAKARTYGGEADEESEWVEADFTRVVSIESGGLFEKGQRETAKDFGIYLAPNRRERKEPAEKQLRGEAQHGGFGSLNAEALLRL